MLEWLVKSGFATGHFFFCDEFHELGNGQQCFEQCPATLESIKFGQTTRNQKFDTLNETVFETVCCYNIIELLNVRSFSSQLFKLYPLSETRSKIFDVCLDRCASMGQLARFSNADEHEIWLNRTLENNFTLETKETNG